MSASASTWAFGKIHGRFVHERRVRVLAQRLGATMPSHSRILDIGCGDGRISALLRSSVSEVEVEGVEVLPRADCAIPCRAFDGIHLPYPDDSFDFCLLVDVLHHVDGPATLLREACRVSSGFVLIKDHVADKALDRWTLRFMDWIGNSHHGVALPYSYLSRSQWRELYCEVNVSVDCMDCDLPLYPVPFSVVFGRNLHFISRIEKSAALARRRARPEET